MDIEQKLAEPTAWALKKILAEQIEQALAHTGI